MPNKDNNQIEINLDADKLKTIMEDEIISAFDDACFDDPSLDEYLARYIASRIIARLLSQAILKTA